MQKKTSLVRDIIVVGFALFSMFFGAGNVIFPPFLGLESGSQWASGFAAYFIADIGLAMLAMFALLRVGSSEAVVSRVGQIPAAVLMSAIILCVGPMVAIPRTSATTYEMAIVPNLSGVSPVVFSILFFALILAAVHQGIRRGGHRGQDPDAAAAAGPVRPSSSRASSPRWVSPPPCPRSPTWPSPASRPAIRPWTRWPPCPSASSCCRASPPRATTAAENSSAWWAALPCWRVSCCWPCTWVLTYLGATVSAQYTNDIGRAQLIMVIIEALMGKVGMVLFGVVVGLACVTTAVALTSSAAAYFTELCRGKVSYKVFVIAICVFSAVVSNLGLDRIVAVAAPVLDVIYPPTLVLIFISLLAPHLPDRISRGAAIGALLTSVLCTLTANGVAIPLVENLPLYDLGLSWLIPAAVFGLAASLLRSHARKAEKVFSKPNEEL